MAKGLGKGLSALMSDDDTVVASMDVQEHAAGDRVVRLRIDTIQAGIYQPRRNFAEEDLHELADSIEKNGIIQPIIVRNIGGGRYEIIAGERRFRAAQLVKLDEMPAIIRKMEDTEALEVALIENIQRQDLNPLEEAQAFQRLLKEFSHSQESLARAVGKSRSHIANLLRLLQLPDAVKAYVDAGTLSMGHARALLNAKEPEILAKRIVAEGLNVRQAEALARGESLDTPPSKEATTAGHARRRGENSSKLSGKQGDKPNDVADLEAMLSENLGLKVSITQHGAQKGEVTVGYETLMQLDEVLRRLGGAV
jgi:ParB family chromosome partitioning protein